MTTATSDEARTEPIPVESGAVDTGPRRVLALAEEENLSYRDIAKRLHISPATVTRRIKEARDDIRAQRLATAVTVMCTVITICVVILTAAVATMAWA